mmetsp:Transcript_100940/g.293971  ORF Transcript_100940/g.293971 Transcript_100940/m.293971 type:complete len:207 (+) Transcript_100940:1293-1913(+)
MNLLPRISLVTFSMTAIIFFVLADKACTQRAMLKPATFPPHAANKGGEISSGCETPWPYTTIWESLSPDCKQWISCSQESRVATPSSASLGSMRWLRSRHLSSATASGKTSSAPMVTSHSLMRSYCARTVGGATARESASCHAALEPYSPLTTFFGAPGRGSMHRGFSFNSLQSCKSALPEEDRWAAFMRTESPGLSLDPYSSSTT